MFFHISGSPGPAQRPARTATHILPHDHPTVYRAAHGKNAYENRKINSVRTPRKKEGVVFFATPSSVHL